MVRFTDKEIKYLLDAMEGIYDWRTPETKRDYMVLKHKLQKYREEEELRDTADSYRYSYL